MLAVKEFRCLQIIPVPLRQLALGGRKSLFRTAWAARDARSFTTTGTEQASPVAHSWIDHRYIHPTVRPYLHLARADKQVGTMLLLWPCIWSTALAAPLGVLPDVALMAKFAVGAFVMRGAGCTINDLWDKDFDKHVERTKTRPLASGALSVSQALGFLGLQLSAGMAVLLSLNAECVLLSFASMPLVVAYPLMKRYTNWPQLVLGLTFNWGAFVGWTAAAGSGSAVLTDVVNRDGGASALGLAQALVDVSVEAASRLPAGLLESALPLYGAGVCWTLIYDTLYGYQDRNDDRRIGMLRLVHSLLCVLTLAMLLSSQG